MTQKVIAFLRQADAGAHAAWEETTTHYIACTRTGRDENVLVGAAAYRASGSRPPEDAAREGGQIQFLFVVPEMRGAHVGKSLLWKANR